MSKSKEKYTLDLFSKVAELNAFLQDSTDRSHWGRNVIDVAMDIIDNQRKEINKLEEVVKAMKSEIEYSLNNRKSEDVNVVCEKCSLDT